ncbi:MAG: diguanylate cyclase [Helicobacter sp.]|uniref:GGDEF domain-containing protein n=1 Tax=Helicobacter sp. TaxID=218 RepID=UPI0025BEEFEB|nr:diguanylate cyclase [Helicobacter sp.]MCH5313078.1 diguanylate cyclase [Helicobacter sp.]
MDSDDVGNNNFFGNLDDAGLEENLDKQPQKVAPPPAVPAEITQKLRSIYKQALQALEKDDVLPLPENFEAYFEKTLLQEQDEKVREKIEDIVESAHHDSRLIELEKVFNDNFTTLRDILERLLTLCKQMSAMESNTDKRLAEIATITNPLGVQNVIKMLMNEIRGFHKQFVEQADFITRSYRDMYAQSSAARSGTIYDTTLDIYTRSFFIYTLELECKNIKDFPRNCAVAVFAPTKELASQLNEQNQLVVIFKNISRIVAKNIGTKDVLSYLGGGRFGMLLKNVSADAAVALCEEVIKKCKATNVFIGGTELQLNIAMGGVVFDGDKTPETMIEEAKEQLQLAQKERESLKFAQAQTQSRTASSASSDDAEDFELPGESLGDLDDFNLS